MRNFLSAILLIAILHPTNAVGALKKWNERMQELGGVLNELLPEIRRSGVKQALNLTVRVKEDPDRASAVLDHASSIIPPLFFLQDMNHWRSSILAWKKEKGKTPNTEATLHRKAKKLIDEARTVQIFPVDRSADILYLRATALLHAQLRQAPRGPLAAEALFLLGKAYEVLGDLQSKHWHELFYETCIRQRPHSPLSRSCYEAYEGSLYFGYSGSGGLSLPADVQQMLAELRGLAAKAK